MVEQRTVLLVLQLLLLTVYGPEIIKHSFNSFYQDGAFSGQLFSIPRKYFNLSYDKRRPWPSITQCVDFHVGGTNNENLRRLNSDAFVVVTSANICKLR